MKNKILIGLLIALVMALSFIMISCGDDDETSGNDAASILYVSEANTTITTVDGRNYTKLKTGLAAVGLAYINGYTGPVLVGITPDSVQYSFKYSGTNIVDEYGMLEYNGKTYYYSKNIGFMSGNYLPSDNSIYCCQAKDIEGAALEIAKLIDQEKFKLPTISTVEELKALNGKSDAVALGANIDLSSETNWTPIEFNGFLDGAGYTISNLKIDAVNVEGVGLFSKLTGTVENLVIENAQVSAKGNAGKAGIVVGINEGVIKNVTVSGEVSAQYYDSVGGIAGYANAGSIVNCINKANVIGANNVGGICGYVAVDNNNDFHKNINEGIITGSDKVGGIAGLLSCVRSNTTYVIENAVNQNTVTGANNVGGVFGEVYGYYQRYDYRDYTSYFELTLLKNSADVIATGDHVGGLVGKCSNVKKLSVGENYADISGGNYVGGLVGYAPNTNIQVTGAVNNNTITGKGMVGGFAGYAGIIENAQNNGSIISTALMVQDSQSVAYVGGIAGYCEGLINCTNNSDITVTTTGKYVGGLAGYIIVNETDKVNNNKNYGAITGTDYVGGIAGKLTCVRSNATYNISNNVNSNIISGASNVGGIFGEAYAFYQHYDYRDYYSYFEFTLLENKADVNATSDYVGGLIGNCSNVNKISVCSNEADVIGANYVGGFVGYAPQTNIQATGFANNYAITGKAYVGGFAGYAGLIENATNNGAITSTAIIVEDATSMSYVGGIAGYCEGLVKCVNNSDIIVNLNGRYVGGLAGYMYIPTAEKSIVEGNINTGKVKGYDYVGGIAGYICCPRSNATYKVTQNKNQNTVEGNQYVGGILGYAYAFYQHYSYKDYYSYFELTYCTNEAEITGKEFFGGIVGGHNNLITDSNIMDTNTTLYGDKLGHL